MRQTFGGDTLNTAVYLARSGAARGVRASYATGLGDDRYSDEMLRRWHLEGVGTELVRRLPGRVPGLYTISVDERGERTFTYWRDSSAARAYFDVAETPLEQAADGLDALYFSGISLAILNAGARAAVRDRAARARARRAGDLRQQLPAEPVGRCADRASRLRAGTGLVGRGAGDAGRRATAVRRCLAGREPRPQPGGAVPRGRDQAGRRAGDRAGRGQCAGRGAGRAGRARRRHDGRGRLVGAPIWRRVSQALPPSMPPPPARGSRRR